MQPLTRMFVVGSVMCTLALLLVPSSVLAEELSPEVKAVLQSRMQFLVDNLGSDPVVVQAVKQANQQNQGLTLDEILALDRKWRAVDGVDNWIRNFLSNPCANQLIDFQDEYDGYPEIFVADAHGLNVCTTNKTSDYYQADEQWWVDGYNDGSGKVYHGDVEYDESAMAEAIACYIPVKEQGSDRAIGVMKVVVDITAIKMEL